MVPQIDVEHYRPFSSIVSCTQLSVTAFFIIANCHFLKALKNNVTWARWETFQIQKENQSDQWYGSSSDSQRAIVHATASYRSSLDSQRDTIHLCHSGNKIINTQTL